MGGALLAAVGLCPGAFAQTTADTSAPIVTKQSPGKAVWMKAEVVHADRNAIIVRERDNGLKVHTFTYSEKARDKMNQILEDGGYQSGDAVRIKWLPGSSEALDIKGRPSPSK